MAISKDVPDDIYNLKARCRISTKIGPQHLVPCALLEQILQWPLCEIKQDKWIIDVILWAFLIGKDMVHVLPGMLKEPRWLPKVFFHYDSHKKVQKDVSNDPDLPMLESSSSPSTIFHPAEKVSWCFFGIVVKELLAL